MALHIPAKFDIGSRSEQGAARRAPTKRVSFISLSRGLFKNMLTSFNLFDITKGDIKKRVKNRFKESQFVSKEDKNRQEIREHTFFLCKLACFLQLNVSLKYWLGILS